MIPRWIRVPYYAILSPIMRMNGFRHRIFPSSRSQNTLRAHLGPGRQRHLDEWINVDANIITCRPDIWADLRFKLPFPDNYLDCIYSHHVIEHLRDLDFHISEMFRCLKPGGLVRIGGPHGDSAMKAMIDGWYEWFGDWPIERRSMGGRFENFIFCKGEHLTILTESFLTELLRDAGFEDIQVCAPGETRNPDMISRCVLSLEPNIIPELPRTLMIEARKSIIE